MTTKVPVRILYLEDEMDDVALVRRTLEHEPINAQLQVVTTRAEFMQTLERGAFDVILSDSGLAGIDGNVALQIARRARPEVPFIFFCGSYDEERNINRLKELGAADCVTKDHFEQLGVVILNAMTESNAAHPLPAVNPLQDPSLAVTTPNVVGHVQPDPVQAEKWYPHVMEYLVTVVQELSLARDLEGIQLIVRRAARQICGADGATFVLREGDQCFYADEDAISPLWKGQRFPMSLCISGWVMQHGQPAAIDDIYNDARVPAVAYRPTFVKSLAMVPIRTSAPIGAIGNYWATPHLTTPLELKALQALADSTSVAMENVQLYAELEQRVKDRTAALQAVNKELETFSYSVSHDLRAPLRAINGFSNLLKKEYSEMLDERANDYVTRILTGSIRMGRLIDDLLKLAHTARAPLDRQAVDLADIARQAMDALRANDTLRTVEVVIEEQLNTEADPGLMRVVLDNLLGNAWKFTSKTEHARIEFGRAPGPEGNPIYTVRDNGAGFEMQYAQRLFGPFQRLHKESEFPGTGVGLATVQRIIQKHGGRIWAESAPRQGAAIHFTLG